MSADLQPQMVYVAIFRFGIHPNSVDAICVGGVSDLFIEKYL